MSDPNPPADPAPGDEPSTPPPSPPPYGQAYGDGVPPDAAQPPYGAVPAGAPPGPPGSHPYGGPGQYGGPYIAPIPKQGGALKWVLLGVGLMLLLTCGGCFAVVAVLAET
ncbi:MAG: hypothetical protein ACR2JD_08355, partial [Nocardioides sp.]